MPGATGKLKEIHFKYVDFENNGHIERLVLSAPGADRRRRSPTPRPATTGSEMTAAIDNGIKKIDDNNYEIDKALVDKVLANPMAVAKGARIVPAMKNGKPDGFKLYAIRPTRCSPSSASSNGDTLEVDQRLRADLGRQGARGLHEAARRDVARARDHAPRQAVTCSSTQIR